MTEKSFIARNGLFVANTFLVNSTGHANAPSYSVGTGFTANSTVVNAIAYNIDTSFTANSTVVNAISFRVGTSFLANSTVVNAPAFSVGTSFIANTTKVVIGVATGLQANGGIGTDGQVLTSNGTTAYWGAVEGALGGTVTTVTAANGINGGTITVTGTISIKANTGITVNTSGVFVNSAYIATIAANSANYANASISNTFTIGTGHYFVSNGNLGLSNNAPTHKLSVNGTTYLQSNLTIAGGTINTSGANIAHQTLTTSGATIAWDMSLGQVATVTLPANRTMGAPSNLKVGTYILHVIQDATGSRLLTWNSVFKWPAGVSPSLSTAAGSRDIFSFISDGTNLYGSYLLGVS